MTLLAQFAATGGSGAANYIEDVFSTWLYTGTGAAQTITNGIDLAGKGGLVWLKPRNSPDNHVLWDTLRGATKGLLSNNSDAEFTQALGLTSFNSAGFTVGSGQSLSSTNYASWTFREQPKFFDVVTYTGNGANRTIAHSLSSVPGCIIVKRTDISANWQVYHRSNANTQYMVLNDTAAVATGATRWNSTTPTDTVFSLGTDTTVNASGGTYVAYLFAHNAGGFGLTGTDNVISCGSYTGDGTSAVNVELGFEPQWLLVKRASNITGDVDRDSWHITDNMRGMTAFDGSGGTSAAELRANAPTAEANLSDLYITSTGFVVGSGNWNTNPSATYIYIAIRRGPMKVPTTGTSVYYAQAVQDVNTSFATGFPVDMAMDRYGFWNGSQVPQTGSFYVYDRLRGSPNNLVTNTTAAETTSQPAFFVATTGFQSNTRLGVGPGDGSLGNNYAFFWNFRRAPSFFDEVCYTGNGVNGRTVSHNLTVAPELIIVKNRSASADWAVYANGPVGCLILNATNGANGIANFPVGTPTTTTFAVASSSGVNGSGNALVAYLFATCPGVSKVGSYTGTATTQQINCGFTAGSRFVLIKRTDDTGDWYVWDSARGIVAGNDPYLLLNSTAAEVTSTDYVDTFAAGFELTATAPAAINASGGSYIFLAIA
jgi:hypothetical protein